MTPNMQQHIHDKIPGIFRTEIALWIGIATTLIFFFVG